MTTKNTGGPAFPLNVEPCNALDYQGMTLRDYFAAKAMQGTMARCATDIIPQNVEAVAGICYRIADAMLEARNK